MSMFYFFPISLQSIHSQAILESKLLKHIAKATTTTIKKKHISLIPQINMDTHLEKLKEEIGNPL